jgi:hypothetical protein
MACPNQEGARQGQHGANRDVLVDNDMGIGSGWQQVARAIAHQSMKMERASWLRPTPPASILQPSPKYLANDCGQLCKRLFSLLGFHLKWSKKWVLGTTRLEHRQAPGPKYPFQMAFEIAQKPF